MENLEEKKLKELGERLRYFRKLKGYTNYEHLAYDLGVSRSQYGKHELEKKTSELEILKSKKLVIHLKCKFS